VKNRLRGFRRVAPALVAALCSPLAALPALAATPDAGPIFKCTDGSGRVTYQNEPCPKDVKAGRVDIFDNRWTADRAEREAEWRRNAAEHRLATGMPGRWVREALGEPSEVRDTPTAGAAQLWLYSLPDRSVQVGMLNDQVLWFRETPVTTPAAQATPAPARSVDQPAQPVPPTPRGPTAANRSPADLPVTRLAPPAPERAPVELAPNADTLRGSVEGTRPAAEVPRTAAEASPAAAPATTLAGAKTTARSVARGQDCRQALADLGPPDRQREVPAIDAGSDPATEYFYESSAAASTGRLRIVCSNGKVEGVDRSVAR
jgi:Domain of unknown function (DUF4124)